MYIYYVKREERFKIKSEKVKKEKTTGVFRINKNRHKIASQCPNEKKQNWQLSGLFISAKNCWFWSVLKSFSNVFFFIWYQFLEFFLFQEQSGFGQNHVPKLSISAHSHRNKSNAGSDYDQLVMIAMPKDLPFNDIGSTFLKTFLSAVRFIDKLCDLIAMKLLVQHNHVRSSASSDKFHFSNKFRNL